MKKHLEDLRAGAGGIAFLMSGIGPKPVLEAPNDGGSGGNGSDGGDGGDDGNKPDDTGKKPDDTGKKPDDGKKPDEGKKKSDTNDDGLTDAEREKRDLLREVMEKKNRLRDAEAEKARLEAELKKFEGIDLDKVRQLLDAEKQREEEELERKGEWERLKERMSAERQAEKQALEEQLNVERQERERLAKVVDELTVGQQFANSSFIKEDLVLTPAKARVLFGSYFEMKDGRVVAYDKPAGAADRTPLVDAGGDPLSFDAALKKLVEADPEKDTLLRAKGAPGAGSRTQQVPTVQKPDPELKGAARIAAALAARQSK